MKKRENVEQKFKFIVKPSPCGNSSPCSPYFPLSHGANVCVFHLIAEPLFVRLWPAQGSPLLPMRPLHCQKSSDKARWVRVVMTKAQFRKVMLRPSRPTLSSCQSHDPSLPPLYSLVLPENYKKLSSGIVYADMKRGRSSSDKIVEEGSRVNVQWVLRKANGYFVDSSEVRVDPNRTSETGGREVT